MSYWQDVANEHFPDQGFQTPAELYVHAGIKAAGRALRVQVVMDPGNITASDKQAELAHEKALRSAVAGVGDEVIAIVGYRLGSQAMFADGEAGNYNALDGLLPGIDRNTRATRARHFFAALGAGPLYDSQTLAI